MRADFFLSFRNEQSAYRFVRGVPLARRADLPSLRSNEADREAARRKHSDRHVQMLPLPQAV